MFSPSKHPIVRDDSDREDEVRTPGTSLRKRPLVRDDSDSECGSEDVPLESPCKRMRRVVLDEEDEEAGVVERATKNIQQRGMNILDRCLLPWQQASMPPPLRFPIYQLNS